MTKVPSRHSSICLDGLRSLAGIQRKCGSFFLKNVNTASLRSIQPDHSLKYSCFHFAFWIFGASMMFMTGKVVCILYSYSYSICQLCDNIVCINERRYDDVQCLERCFFDCHSEFCSSSCLHVE